MHAKPIRDQSAGRLAARIGESPSSRVSPENRGALSRAIATFHAQSGLAPRTLSQSLARIGGGSTIVRLAHQPNFLPYDNLLLQMRYIHHLENLLALRGHEAVAVVLLVDHDIGSNDRFHTSHSINPNSTVATFNYPVRSPQCRIAIQGVPNAQYFKDVSNKISEISYGFSRINREVLPRSSSEILDDLLPKTTSPITTTIATSFAWLRMAYSYGFAPNLLFASLSDLHDHLRPIYLDLNARLGPDSSGTERYWAVCLKCDGRQRVRRSAGQHFAECTNCRIESKISDPSRDFSCRIIPRVAIDLLSDYVGLDISGGTTYGSGLAHMRKSRAVGKKNGILAPPEAIWRSNVLHCGPSGIAAYDQSTGNRPARLLREILTTGRMGLAYYLGLPSELEFLRQSFDHTVNLDETPAELYTHIDAPPALRSWLRSIAELRN